jgi:hypothetical protein
MTAQHGGDQEAGEGAVARFYFGAFWLLEGLGEGLLEESAAFHDAPEGFDGGLARFKAGREGLGGFRRWLKGAAFLCGATC